MQTLEPSDIEHIFNLITDSIDASNNKPKVYLNDMKPFDHEHDSVLWRYRLEGYLHGLEATDVIERSKKSKISHKLLGIRPVDKKSRPGRDFLYSVDLFCERGHKFSFDVPATNPTDAYFQLTKRVAYKSIPDINLVEVFTGLKSDREPNTTPVKVFPKSDLIFVTLV